MYLEPPQLIRWSSVYNLRTTFVTNVTKISILDVVEVLDLPLIGKYCKIFRSIEMIVTSLFLEPFFLATRHSKQILFGKVF